MEDEWITWDSCDTTYFGFDSADGLGAEIYIHFTNGDIDYLIEQGTKFCPSCPSNCPMKRGNSCLSNKCVKDYPRLEEENQT